MTTTIPFDFFEAALDSFEQHVILLDDKGNILWVNRSWRDFWRTNDGDPHVKWTNQNYFEVCKKASSSGDKIAKEVIASFRGILRGDAQSFSMEYPCHRPQEQRWFVLRASRTSIGSSIGIIVTHENITGQKISSTDKVTGLFNRTKLEEFLAREWLISRQKESQISLIMIDLDYFKEYNDTYGHCAGDKCLRSVAQAVLGETRNNADLVARYGGDELVAVLPYCGSDQATKIAKKMRESVLRLGIEHIGSKCCTNVSVSLGVSTIAPANAVLNTHKSLLDLADRELFIGKRQGRNQVARGNFNLDSRLIKLDQQGHRNQLDHGHNVA